MIHIVDRFQNELCVRANWEHPKNWENYKKIILYGKAYICTHLDLTLTPQSSRKRMVCKTPDWQAQLTFPPCLARSGRFLNPHVCCKRAGFGTDKFRSMTDRTFSEHGNIRELLFWLWFAFVFPSRFSWLNSPDSSFLTRPPFECVMDELMDELIKLTRVLKDLLQSSHCIGISKW